MKGQLRNFNWRRMAVGAATSLLTAVTMCAVAAGLVGAGRIGEEWTNYLAAGIVVGAAFVGTMMSGELTEQLTSGCIFWLLLAVINGIGYGGEVSGAGETLLAIAGGCGAAMLLQYRKYSTMNQRHKLRVVKLNKKFR